MPLVIECPLCRKDMTSQPELVGRPLACPHCGGRIMLADGGRRAIPLGPSARTEASGAAFDPQLTDKARFGSGARAGPFRFNFTCQRCGSILEARSGLCGQSGRCPTCGAVFVIPPVDPRTGLAAGPAQVADDGQLPTPMHAYATAGGKAPSIKRNEVGDQVIVCPRCSSQMAIDANACSRCGLPFTMEGASAVASPTQSGGLATVAMTLGIIGTLTFMCVGPVLGILAIAFGAVALRDTTLQEGDRSRRGMAWAGLILGITSVGVAIGFHWLF